MPVVVRLIDVDGNDIPYDRMSAKPTYINGEETDVFTLQLLDELTNVTDAELNIIRELIEEKLKYGNDVDISRMLLELYDKIDKLIKRKRGI